MADPEKPVNTLAETVGRALGSIAGRIEAVAKEHPHPIDEARELITGRKPTRVETAVKRAKKVARRVKKAAVSASRTVKRAARRRVKTGRKKVKKAVARGRKAVARGRKALRRR